MTSTFSLISEWAEPFFREFSAYSIRVFLFSIVQKMAENHGGFLPHPTKGGCFALVVSGNLWRILLS
jgi:hypothetical protein